MKICWRPGGRKTAALAAPRSAPGARPALRTAPSSLAASWTDVPGRGRRTPAARPWNAEGRAPHCFPQPDRQECESSFQMPPPQLSPGQPLAGPNLRPAGSRSPGPCAARDGGERKKNGSGSNVTTRAHARAHRPVPRHVQGSHPGFGTRGAPDSKVCRRPASCPSARSR